MHLNVNKTTAVHFKNKLSEEMPQTVMNNTKKAAVKRPNTWQ